MSDETNHTPGRDGERQAESRGPDPFEPSRESGNGCGPSNKQQTPDSDQDPTEIAANQVEQKESREQEWVENSKDDQPEDVDESSPMDFGMDNPATEEDLYWKFAIARHDEYLTAGDQRSYLLGNSKYDTPEIQPDPMLDLIRCKRDRQIYVCLIRWEKNQCNWSYGSVVKYDDRNHYVPDLPPALYVSLLLPTDVAPFGSVRELFSSVQTLLRKHTMLSEKQGALLTYWCIASWFTDFLDFIPRLTITGPGFAADLLMQALHCVCRRPVLLANMNSAVLKAIAFDQLNPTLLIRNKKPSRQTTELLDASDRRGYLVASGKDLRSCYGATCVYLGQDYDQRALPTGGIHIHIALDACVPWQPIRLNGERQHLQNQLLFYRAWARAMVRDTIFNATGLPRELWSVAQPLGAAIVEDAKLQRRVIELLKEESEKTQVDRACGPSGTVLRAILHYCHQEEKQQVFVREIAASVNKIYAEEGESLKVNNETVGHILKNLGLYTRRLGSGGRGLLLDRSTRSRVHELSQAHDVLPNSTEVAACGHCHQLQVTRSSGDA